MINELIGLLGIVSYFIPSIIAIKKRHKQKTAIICLNILAGWTLIGWIAALIWSVIKEEK